VHRPLPGEAGDAAAARDQFAALLPISEQVLGPDHPDTLNARHNLALWTGNAGDAAAARTKTLPCWPFGSGSSARTTPTPWPPGTTMGTGPEKPILTQAKTHGRRRARQWMAAGMYSTPVQQPACIQADHGTLLRTTGCLLTWVCAAVSASLPVSEGQGVAGSNPAVPTGQRYFSFVGSGANWGANGFPGAGQPARWRSPRGCDSQRWRRR
jgi:hypothetical protein